MKKKKVVEVSPQINNNDYGRASTTGWILVYSNILVS